MNTMLQRQKRLNDLLKFIKTKTTVYDGITKKDLLPLMAINFGYRDELTENYLDILERAGLIHIDGDLITAIIQPDELQSTENEPSEKDGGFNNE